VPQGWIHIKEKVPAQGLVPAQGMKDAQEEFGASGMAFCPDDAQGQRVPMQGSVPRAWSMPSDEGCPRDRSTSRRRSLPKGWSLIS